GGIYVENSPARTPTISVADLQKTIERLKEQLATAEENSARMQQQSARKLQIAEQNVERAQRRADSLAQEKAKLLETHREQVADLQKTIERLKEQLATAEENSARMQQQSARKLQIAEQNVERAQRRADSLAQEKAKLLETHREQVAGLEQTIMQFTIAKDAAEQKLQEIQTSLQLDLQVKDDIISSLRQEVIKLRPPPTPIGKSLRCIAHFEASDTDELSLSVGDTVFVALLYADGWARVSKRWCKAMCTNQ
ncbi:hypothetical protein HDU93_007763, partial [Gonapodya sp. JEL0774]